MKTEIFLRYAASRLNKSMGPDRLVLSLLVFEPMPISFVNNKGTLIQKASMNMIEHAEEKVLKTRRAQNDFDRTKT